MAILRSAMRKEMPASQFAGPGQTFPVNDAAHQRLAIGGATRAERAGNISPDMAETIKAKARKLLAKRKK